MKQNVSIFSSYISTLSLYFLLFYDNMIMNSLQDAGRLFIIVRRRGEGVSLSCMKFHVLFKAKQCSRFDLFLVNILAGKWCNNIPCGTPG